MPIALVGRGTRHGRRFSSAHILALVATYIAAHPVGAQEETSPANPAETARILDELRVELAATHARLDLLEDLIAELSSRVVDPDATFSNPVTFVRLDDEEHEFVSYPVHIGQDETNTLLKRVGYVTYHDDDHRIPLWVSYRVSREWLDVPAYIPRNKLRWRTDPELSGTGARDRDYRGSGYSRGHMAMQALLRGRSPECEREGFCFANAIPQRQSFNAGIWLQLEYQVMSWAREYGDVWVVCGPVLPADPVKLNGRTYRPGQGNNAYIFPGVGLGAVVSGATRITDSMFHQAAMTLAQAVPDHLLKEGCVFPALTAIQPVSARIAVAVATEVYRLGLGSVPEPPSLEEAVANAIWKPEYR